MDAASPGRVDHAAVARMQEFRDLVDKRRRFVMVALGVASIWFGSYALLASYGHGFMQHIITPGLSVAYVLGLSQFLLVWGITAAYLRIATRTLDPMQAGVVAAAQGVPFMGLVPDTFGASSTPDATSRVVLP